MAKDKPRRRKILAAVKGLVGGVVLLTAAKSCYTVDQSEHAVVTQFGKPVRVILNPLGRDDNQERIKKIEKSYSIEGISFDRGAGLRFKIPYIQSVTKFPRLFLRWNGYPEQIPSSDKKYLWVDTTARVYIEDPLKFLRSVRTEEQMHGRLDDIIDSTTRNSLTQRDLIETVRTDNREMRVSEKELAETTQVGKIKEGRYNILTEITEKSRKACEEYGLGIPNDGILLKGLVYVESVKESVEARMKAERDRIAKKYTSEGEGEYQRIMGQKEREVMKILSEAYKSAREIEGVADAEATKIYADAFGKDKDFYQLWRTLELYKKSLASPQTRLILGTDNPLLRMISGNISLEQKEEIKQDQK